MHIPIVFAPRMHVTSYTNRHSFNLHLLGESVPIRRWFLITQLFFSTFLRDLVWRSYRLAWNLAPWGTVSILIKRKITKYFLIDFQLPRDLLHAWPEWQEHTGPKKPF